MLTGAFLLGSVVLGATLGAVVPAASGPADALVSPLIFGLVTTLLLGIRTADAGSLRRAPRVVLVACGFNFVLVPVVAFAVSSLVMADADALRIGVLLYCLFPCTDWFLGFTRLAGGDTRIGGALIPLNMTLQLLLFPLYLHVLTGAAVAAPARADWSNLVAWFAIPAVVALGLRLGAREVRHTPLVLRGSDVAVPVILNALVVALFAANVGTVLDHPVAFARVLVTVFFFLATTFLLGEVVTRRLAFAYPERALIVMTTSARNAPLILALTIVALPHQPLVYAAIVLGMLVEFPHLTTLQFLLRRFRDRAAPSLRPAEVLAP